MSIERLKTMKENFMCAVESQMYNLAEVDAEELGEVVDMIKDLSEAIYYCEVAKAMEESEKNEKNGNGQQQEMMYYTPMYYNDGGRGQGGGRGNSYYPERSGNTDGRDMPRMYYDGGGSSGGGGGSGQGGSSSGGSSSGGGGNSGGSSSGGSGGGSSYYTEREMPRVFEDPREGKSYRSRRMYMEAKETHSDKSTQMKELEKYAQELTSDIVEMVEDASPEEKQYLSKKITALATKINQLSANA